MDEPGGADVDTIGSMLWHIFYRFNWHIIQKYEKTSNRHYTTR